ncbi:shikimate kinase [Jatrophihabitans sp. DSM 45814]
MAVQLVIVGLPGAGKSSVGAAVANRLGLPFLDSDDLVHEMTGRPVGEIIADDGEAAFREIEAAAILDTLIDFGGVLALGGGAVTTAAVRQELRDSAVPVALLTADQPTLVARIGNTQHRPLLAGDTAARLLELESQRAELYREVATISIDTSALSIDEVAAQLANQLKPTQP